MKRKTFGSIWSRRVLGPAIAMFLVVVMLAGAPGAASAHGWGRVKQVDKFVKKIGDNVSKQTDLRFGDLAEALWAASSIAKMRGLGVINGYDGNVFKPNTPVKQAEALTMMVRAFDLEDEANELADRFGLSYAQLDEEYEGNGKSNSRQDWDDEDDEEDDDDYGMTVTLSGMLLPQVNKNSRWALGYVLLAVEEGWVKLSECNPEKSASRAWISKVMVRALDHETQALAKMNATLPFTDAAAVPADSVGYVAEAVSMGLFVGYDDGTFQPNKPVTRAEMATILERFLGDELPSDMPYLATGTVQSVSSNKVVLKNSAGTVLTYTVSADALIIVDRVPSILANVKVGDVVEVLSNGTGTALLLTVKSHGTLPPAANEVTGEIVGIATPAALTLKIEGQANKTIVVASNCTIKMGTTTLTYSQLLLGDTVKVTIQNNQATAISVISRAATGQKVTGVIQGITTSSAGIDVVVKQGTTTKTLRLAQNVQVTFGTTTLTAADLRVNDQIEATVQSGVTTQVKILVRDFSGDLDGTVTSVTQTSTETVIVVSDQGTSTTVKVTPQTAITYGTTTLTRGDLRVGDVIEVTVQNNQATAISVQTRVGTEKITGVIQGITTSSAGIEVVVKKGTTLKTLRLAQNVQVTYGSTTLTAADLRANDEIEATIQSGVTTQVKILVRDSSGDYDGTITSVTHTSTETTIVVSKQGISTTIKVTPQTAITFGTTTLTRGDLRVGDVVEVTVHNNQATAISVQTRVGTEKVTGVIQGITTSSAGIDVVVKQVSTTRTLRLGYHIPVTFGTTTLTTADLRANDEIEATIESSVVTSVKILARDVFGDLGGTITSVTQTATETTIVISNQGTTTTVKVTPQTVITFGTTTLARGDLRIGDVLRLKLVATAATVTAQEIRITTRGA